MKNAKGFTVIELIVVIVIALSLIAVVIGAVNGVSSGSSLSYGFNGVTETRCMDGYKVMVDGNGTARQIMDEFGHGVKCQ